MTSSLGIINEDLDELKKKNCHSKWNLGSLFWPWVKTPKHVMVSQGFTAPSKISCLIFYWQNHSNSFSGFWRGYLHWLFATWAYHNCEYYAKLIQKLPEAIKEKWRGKLRRDVLFHQDNAHSVGFTIFEQPPIR